MKYEEFITKLEALKKEHENKEFLLIKEFVITNNPYKIGDIVTDHIGSVKITSIKISRGVDSYEKPCAVYFGIELRKDLTPKMKQENRPVYQSNLIKK